jgi:hypothetical protein
MSDYLEQVEGKKFLDLVDDENFQRDLVRFFSGSRYGFTREEIEELGPQGLAEEFVQHMRWQSTNEMTALNDYRYVTDDEEVSDEERMSFGNLMTAFDRSEGGGDGFFAGAGDYLSAFITSPSTIATIGTAGWGVGSKLAARAASTSTLAATRAAVADLVAQGATTRAMQNQIAGTVASGVVRGGLTSAAVEGGIGAGQGYLTGETREIATEGTAYPFQYETRDLVRDATISALAGGAIGSVARGVDVRTQRAAIESFASRESAAMQARAEAREVASDRLNQADEALRTAAEDRAIMTAQSIVAKHNERARDPLNAELVSQGNLLREQIRSSTDLDTRLTPSLTVDTVRNVAAATVEISEALRISPNERITSAVANALRLPEDDPGHLTVDALEEIRRRYNLSREEMSYVWLSDLSEAGKKLAEASQIERAVRRRGAVDQAESNVRSIASDLGVLAETRVSTLGETDATNIMRTAYEINRGEGNDILTRGLEALREADGIRIAFMTSQVGTTMANTTTSTFNLAVDASNEFFKGLYRGTIGGDLRELNPRNMFANMTSTVRAASFDRSDALITRGLIMEEFPLEYRNLFYETTRAETAVNSNTRVARVGRFVNTLNTLTDSVFKEMTLYSGLDRRIRRDRTLGANSLGEFLQSGARFSDLPEDIVRGAFDDARRFTFQRDYRGDTSSFGRFARFVENTHQRLPFVVSGVIGVPFPRYIANHLEHIHDYMPIGIATGGLDRLGTMLYPGQRLVGDEFKDMSDRFARAATGSSMILAGYYAATLKEGEVDYDAALTETQTLDISRVAGPYLLHAYLGDAIMRNLSGLPVNESGKELLDIGLGMTDLAPDAGIIGAMRESLETGEFTPEFTRIASDIAATFTYPLTIFRDIQAQINPEVSSIPYTRDVFGGSPDQPNVYGEGNLLDTISLRSGREALNRASRFLMDTDYLQYTQTFNGRNDIPFYDMFGGYVRGSFNPLTNQFGFRPTPRPNDLQREMSRLDITDYDIYSSNTIRNPAVAHVVEARLASNFNQLFLAWREGRTGEGSFSGVSYDQLTTQDQAIAFEGFLRDTIRATEEQVESDWEMFQRESPRAAAGFVRNLYVVEESKIARETNMDDVYDRAVAVHIEGFDNARDFLADADTIEEELARRTLIMEKARLFSGRFRGLPEDRTTSTLYRSGQ